MNTASRGRHVRRWALRLCGVFLALIASGCALADASREQVVGTWTVQPDAASQASPTLVLHDGGTFAARALPREMVDGVAEAAVVATGRWRLSTRGPAQVVQLNVDLPDGKGGRRGWGCQVEILWFGRWLSLSFTRDPDLDEPLIFRRQSS